ncbi:hypothetical protein MAC_04389 [Metarhizium acridum CQMa 102]|uniref:MYND-type domain-containing protein n=1 Tax=Metarhizium acridum (strain CQMa 102) TaxID=655827 RepID=E9E3E1_METAQ|nr:uncharacterized protein MAC_04389 [Metarhizium acridum CQMa 102]EFY89534.1 hypothetical protein MAC_04389 [Metarhizium acridum CQMa 102]
MNADVGKLNGLAPRSCELCHKKDSVARCSACLAVYYCGRECQVKDRDLHKTPCKLIKKARLVYELEEKSLRELPGGLFTPENVFQNCVGRFWGILETRAYMRARYNLVDTMLLSYGTAGGPVDLVQISLDHLLDMMRLCRSDNMGLRQLIPALYIRLGRDQDAYDFMKWYATTGHKVDYDWGNMDEPFLDTKGADVLEAPAKSWRGDFLELSHVVAVVLIKVRIMLDLQAIQNARIALRGVIPEEIIEIIRGKLVSSVVLSRPEILLAGPEETARLAEKIKNQIRELYDVVESYNSHFWDLLVEDPDSGVLHRPAGYSPKSADEALMVVGYSYASWYETPGAVDVLRNLSKQG